MGFSPHGERSSSFLPLQPMKHFLYKSIRAILLTGALTAGYETPAQTAREKSRGRPGPECWGKENHHTPWSDVLSPLGCSKRSNRALTSSDSMLFVSGLPEKNGTGWRSVKKKKNHCSHMNEIVNHIMTRYVYYAFLVPMLFLGCPNKGMLLSLASSCLFLIFHARSLAWKNNGSDNRKKIFRFSWITIN